MWEMEKLYLRRRSRIDRRALRVPTKFRANKSVSKAGEEKTSKNINSSFLSCPLPRGGGRLAEWGRQAPRTRHTRPADLSTHSGQRKEIPPVKMPGQADLDAGPHQRASWEQPSPAQARFGYNPNGEIPLILIPSPGQVRSAVFPAPVSRGKGTSGAPRKAERGGCPQRLNRGFLFPLEQNPRLKKSSEFDGFSPLKD